MKLNLGCGSQVVTGWANVDYALGAKLAKWPLFPHLNRRLKLFAMDWDSRIVLHDLCTPFPWPDATAEVIYSSHTLEHLSRADGVSFLKECRRVLRPGGLIRILVPDLSPIVQDYCNGKLRADQFVEELGVLHGREKSRLKKLLAPYVEFPHRCMYDTATLLSVCADIGFQCRAAKPFESLIPNIKEIELVERTVNAVIVEGTR